MNTSLFGPRSPTKGQESHPRSQISAVRRQRHWDWVSGGTRCFHHRGLEAVNLIILESRPVLCADNGIGVAAALALLDSGADEKLPPLECLFTVDEETGLTGAFGLDASILSGTLSVARFGETMPKSIAKLLWSGCGTPRAYCSS